MNVSDREHALIAVRTPRELGQAVRARRRALGFTQDELARAAGVGRRWIIDLEAGKPSIALGLLMRTLAAISLELSVQPVVVSGHSLLDDVLEAEPE